MALVIIESAQLDAYTCTSDEVKPRKRGRPFKHKPVQSPMSSDRHGHDRTPSAQTPQPKGNSAPQGSPITPPKSTPTGKNVKALPMARDHTTDTLNSDGDEFITREHDDAGERKVTLTGHLTDGREYRCRIFNVPNRGNKLFMLATECARVLQYRDSYLLFNKNRSLVKIIANQPEKEELINQEILPYSYRSRQIAIVTARSMYRQFGARIIKDGRRVKDDYWEHKARKQGFTEEDLASEKRPSTSKPKETSTETSNQSNANAANLLAGNKIEYDTTAVDPPYPIADNFGTTGLMPEQFSYYTTDDMHRDFGNVQRPRQDITGTPYQDRLQSTSGPEIVNQAAQAAEFNRAISQQRSIRGQFLDEAWNREHEVESPKFIEQDPFEETQQNRAAMEQAQTSPPPAMRQQPPMAGPTQQQLLQQQQQIQQQQQQQQRHRRSSSAMLNPALYPGQPQQSNPGMSQSPAQRSQQSMPPGQPPHQRQPSFPYNPSALGHNPNMYGYIQNMQNQMWHQQGPHGALGGPGSQGSPMAQHPNLPHPSQYQHHGPQQSPQLQHSPHHAPSHPQMHPQQNAMPGAAGPGGMPFQNMPAGMPPHAAAGGYANLGMNRSMYQQPHAPPPPPHSGPGMNPQHFMGGGQPGGMPGGQGWPPMAGGAAQGGWGGY